MNDCGRDGVLFPEPRGWNELVAGWLAVNLAIALCVHAYDPKTRAKRPVKERLLLYAVELLSWFAYFAAP